MRLLLVDDEERLTAALRKGLTSEGFAVDVATTGTEGLARAERETYDAVLLDVDHTPRHVLHPSHAPFYTATGLRRLARHLRPGGVFALWSDDPPDDAFTALLREVFACAEAHLVTFANPLTGGTSSNTVYVATTDRQSGD